MLKELKQKFLKKLWKPLHPWLQKRIDQKKFGLTRGPNLLERLKSFGLQRGYKFSLLWVRRTIRSLKNIVYRFLESFAYKYIHKLPQSITTFNSRWNTSIDMTPNTVKNCDFMYVLYSKLLREWKKPTIKTGDRMRISKHDLPFRKGYKFTREIYEIVAIATRKPPTYTIKVEQGEIIRGKFYQKELIKVIYQWTRLQKNWFLTPLENCFQTIHSVLLQDFYQSK